MKLRYAVCAALLTLAACGSDAKPATVSSTTITKGLPCSFEEYQENPDCFDETTTTTVSKWSVTKVVDGDTIDVTDEHGSTSRVRFIGIDTPERGDCGFEQAASFLTDIIGGGPVTLTAGAQDNVDRYGRLLRYVETDDGQDAGLELIKTGYAVARYDSRDGYGTHPNEAAYVQADLSTAAYCVTKGDR